MRKKNVVPLVIVLLVIIFGILIIGTSQNVGKSCLFSSDCRIGFCQDYACVIPSSCEDYCIRQPHIMCVGEWNISGVYPDCVCDFNCDISENESCASYCQSQVHIMCVGHWNILGAYPYCTCQWLCDTGPV